MRTIFTALLMLGLLAAPRAQTLFISDAKFLNQVDNNNDGFPSTFDLAFDPDVTDGYTATVYVKIYSRTTGASIWTYIVTSGDIAINGTTTAYYSMSFTGGGHGYHDYRIDLYDAATDSLVATYGPADDTDLSAHAEEMPSEDIPAAYIADARFANQVDSDSDGYPSTFDLEFDPEKSDTGSIDVYVKVSFRLSGTSAWSYVATTSTITISGLSTVYYSVSLAGSTRGWYDYQLALYDASNDQLLDVYGPAGDSSLARHAEELASEDVPKEAIIFDVRFANQVDNDHDGYPSTFDLQFDPDATGGATDTVYVKLYGRLSGTTTWNPITTSTDIEIVGATSMYYSIALLGGSHGSHDYLVELYDANTDLLLDTYGPAEDADCSGHLEETQAQDTPGAVRPQKAGLTRDTSPAARVVTYSLTGERVSSIGNGAAGRLSTAVRIAVPDGSTAGRTVLSDR